MQEVRTVPCTCITYRLDVLLLSTWFEAWLSRRWATATVFTATAVVISVTMFPMSLVVSPMSTVFLSATTPMLLPMLLKPYWKPALSCRRSQQTLQFLPSSLFQPFPLTTTATATTPITQLQKKNNSSTSSKWHSTHSFIPYTNCKQYFLKRHTQIKYQVLMAMVFRLQSSNTWSMCRLHLNYRTKSMFHTILRQMCVDAHDNGGSLDPRYLQ